MTVEPPQGLRSNLLKTYNGMNDMDLNDCTKEELYKKFLFGLSLFHAVILDRRRFGPLGWNVRYDFTNEDLTVCKKQLKLLLDEFDEIPYQAIHYLFSEIHYGGRITDYNDLKLVSTLVKHYLGPQVNFFFFLLIIYYLF